MRPTDRADDVLHAWLAALGEGGDRDHPGFADAAADVAWALVEAPPRLPGALTRFGRWAGTAGWTLRDVAGWLDRLADLAGPRGRRLAGFDAGSALGAGWSEGYLGGIDASPAVDALTGLGTLDALRHRLQEQAERLAGLGLGLGQVSTLVILDTDLDDADPLHRATVLTLVAEQVRRTFGPTEPAARTADRIVVLTSRLPSTAAHLDTLLGELAGDPALAGRSVEGWLEPLPDDPTLLDAFVADLARPG